MYLVILSNNTKISIDADELNGVMNALGSKNLIRVRQGVFNPSYLVAVVEDGERRRDHLEKQKYMELDKKVRPEHAKIKDIFEKVELLGDNKRIGSGV